MSYDCRICQASLFEVFPRHLFLLFRVVSISSIIRGFLWQSQISCKGLLLFAGDLVNAIDLFDLLMHAAFPLLLLAKAVVVLATRTAHQTGAGDV